MCVLVVVADAPPIGDQHVLPSYISTARSWARDMTIVLCVCVCMCVHVCVRVYVRVYVHACVCVSEYGVTHAPAYIYMALGERGCGIPCMAPLKQARGVSRIM